MGLITGSVQAKCKSQLPFCLAASGGCCGVLHGEQERGRAGSRAVGLAPAQRNHRARGLGGGGCCRFRRPMRERLPGGQPPTLICMTRHCVDMPRGHTPPPPCRGHSKSSWSEGGELGAFPWVFPPTATVLALTHAGLFTWNSSCLLQPSMACQSRLGNLSDSAARWTLSSLEPQGPSLWARETGLRARHPNTQTATLTSTAVSKSYAITHLQMEYVWAQGPPASSFRP